MCHFRFGYAAGIYDTLAVAAVAPTQACNMRGCAGLCQHQLTLVVPAGVEATRFQIAAHGPWEKPGV